jgi:hypothetical protein
METTLRQNGSDSHRAQLISQFLSVTERVPGLAIAQNPILAFHQQIALDSLSTSSRGAQSEPAGFFTYFWMCVWILTLHQLGVSAVMEESRSRSFQFDWKDYRRARADSSTKAWIWHDGHRISPNRNGLRRGGTLARMLHRADAQTEVELWRITSLDSQSMKGAYVDGWTLIDEEMQQPVDVPALAERLRSLGLAGTPDQASA